MPVLTRLCHSPAVKFNLKTAKVVQYKILETSGIIFAHVTWLKHFFYHSMFDL